VPPGPVHDRPSPGKDVGRIGCSLPMVGDFFFTTDVP
jgi:hypothetical protein